MKSNAYNIRKCKIRSALLNTFYFKCTKNERILNVFIRPNSCIASIHIHLLSRWIIIVIISCCCCCWNLDAVSDKRHTAFNKILATHFQPIYNRRFNFLDRWLSLQAPSIGSSIRLYINFFSEFCLTLIFFFIIEALKGNSKFQMKKKKLNELKVIFHKANWTLNILHFEMLIINLKNIFHIEVISFHSFHPSLQLADIHSTPENVLPPIFRSNRFCTW